MKRPDMLLLNDIARCDLDRTEDQEARDEVLAAINYITALEAENARLSERVAELEEAVSLIRPLALFGRDVGETYFEHRDVDQSDVWGSLQDYSLAEPEAGYDPDSLISCDLEPNAKWRIAVKSL